MWKGTKTSSKWRLSGKPFFHMEILTVKERPDMVVVRTTGARYELTRKGMRLNRMIDPKTNRRRPRRVGRLDFVGSDIGPLVVVSADKRSCLVTSDTLTFSFNSDSLFYVACQPSAEHSFEYAHLNLINLKEDWHWHKTGLKRDDVSNPEESDYLSRMWTDGYGGSLHAYVEGDVSVVARDTNRTQFKMAPGSKMAHMVFPPRFFDFEALYGRQAKPLVWMSVGADNPWARIRLEETLNMAADPNSRLHKSPFGYVLLREGNYTGYPSEGEIKYHLPVPLIEPFEPIGRPGDQIRVGYKFAEPDFVKYAICKLQQLGFKVLVYMHSGYNESYPIDFPRQQSLTATLDWMHEWRKEFGFDGYYFDNASYGRLFRDNWSRSYKFIRKVREDIGDDGYIYHHDSVDVWGGHSGLRAIMVNAYCNAQLVGETGELAQVDNPDDPYLRYFTSGYGLSQTIGSHKRLSRMRLALSEREKNRLMGENLNCIEYRSKDPATEWDPIFETAYDAQKEAYRLGWGWRRAGRDVQWPPKWFKRVSDAEVVMISDTTVTITWTTAEPTDSAVAYTSNGVWWRTGRAEWPDGPDGEVTDNTPVKIHSITLKGLRPATTYQYRIRSSNGKPGLDEKIWGYVGVFQTETSVSGFDG